MRLLSVRQLFAAMSVLAAFTAGARTAAEVFVDAPYDVLPLLRSNTRLDLLDYFNHSMPNTSPNRMGGEAKIIECSDSRLLASVSRDATVEIALVPVKNDTVTLVIETVLTPLADSSISFYDSKWKKIGVSGIPGASAPSGKKGEKVSTSDIVFMAASYDPTENVLVFRNTTGGYYSAADRPDWLDKMPSKFTMKFDGKKLIPAEK
ncbi:MAG: DUF3256 family protein [Bacteroidales bacterium]|nr:DUF3256 family protein [Bacteroidales bacterium]